MANPEDFHLKYTPSGLPYLKGKEDVRNLSALEARQRLNELLDARGPGDAPVVTRPTLPTLPSPPPKSSVVPRPVATRSSLRPIALPFQAPKAPEPIKATPIPSNVNQLAKAGALVGQRLSLASAGLSPAGLVAKPFTPAVPYEAPTIPEDEMARVVAKARHEEDIQRAEDIKRGKDLGEIEREGTKSLATAYYNYQEKRPENWNPTPGDLMDLVSQGYLLPSVSEHKGKQWAAFRSRAQKNLTVPARYAALQAEEREKLLPGEAEVRERFFKRGMSLTEAGASINWFNSLDTLKREWRYVLDRKRVKSGKPSIMDASPEEIEKFQEEVISKAERTLSSIAAATGFSISDISDPDRMKNIKWWWAPLEPLRASFSPVTIYTPNSQSVSGDAAQALFALGEPRFVPSAQEAYGTLGKFGRAASLVFTPLSAMLESGEGWSHEETLKRITSGGGDPFDHLQEWGELFGGGRNLGIAVLTLGLILEPEPFTSLLAIPAAGRKALTYAIKMRSFEKTEKALARILPELRAKNLSPAEAIEELAKTEPAAAQFLGITAQQAIGIRGRAAPALRFFDAKLRKAERALEKLEGKLAALSVDETVVGLQAKAASLEEQILAVNFEVMVLREAVASSQRDAALMVRGISADKVKGIKDTKKFTADEQVERGLKAKGKALEAEITRRTPTMVKTGKAVEREDARIGKKLQAILGKEAPEVGRTARGQTRKDWYPIIETPPGAKGPRIARSLERVQWKDVAAVRGADGKWVKSTRKGGVIGGPGVKMQVSDISVGRANQVTKNSTDISLPKSPRKGETFELWIDIISADGKTAYRVRHPISRSSWGARKDAKKLLREGFGINATQAEDLRQAFQIRRVKVEAALEPEALYQLAVANRKLAAVEYDEALNATTAVRLIEAHRVAKTNTAAAKEALKGAQKGAKDTAKKGRKGLGDLLTGVEKEAAARADLAAIVLARESLAVGMAKTLEGTKGLRALLKERTGGIVGAAFKRGINDILNYKQLRPEELEQMVADATVGTLKKGFTDPSFEAGKVFDEASAIVDVEAYAQKIRVIHLRAPGATEETADAAIELLKARSPTAKKVLDMADAEGQVGLRLSGEEVAQWQADTREFFHATWKDRVSSGPLSYANALEREKEFRLFYGPGTWKNVIPRAILREARLPEVAARMTKLRILGVTDDEIADTLIYSSNIYDLGIDELISVTQNGKLGEEAATRAIIDLMDNNHRIALRSDKLGSVQYQEFERVLGADSRFAAARAALLEDFRVVPRREITPAKLARRKEEIAKTRNVDPDTIEDSEIYALLGGPEIESSVPLQGMAYAFYPGGIGSVDKAKSLEQAALKILRGIENEEGVLEGGAKTFQEFADRMAEATHKIIGDSDTSIQAYTMAATAATGAATSGYAKNLISKMTYAPITQRQALAANRLLTGNPDTVVEAGGKGWQKAALSEKEIEEGIEALNRLGLPVGELGLKFFSESDVIPRVKELIRIGKDGAANPYAIRSLINEIDKFSGGATKRLAARTPRATPLNALQAGATATFNSYLRLSSIWRTSVTTGLLLPNPGYWANNVVGDLSQIWLQEGLGTAAKMSFNNFANNIPYWGRGLADRQLAMQAWAAKKGKDALPSPLEVFMNPYLGKLLKGEDFTMVSKSGMRIEARTLVKEAIEDGIYSTQVNQELFDLYKSALQKDHAWAAFRDLGRSQNKAIADHANIVQQRQRMALYAHYRIDMGLSRKTARSRTLEALYDWKDGVAATELNVFVKLSPFYRFWRLGMRQIAGAFLDPVTRPLISELKKSLIGQTKIARVKQQIQLFGGMPEIFGYENMVEGNRDAALLDAYYSNKFPEWMDTRIITGYYGMPSDKGYRDWYLKQYGIDYDSMAHIAPTATILDTAGLAANLLETTYAVSHLGKLPFLKDSTVPTNWASKATEPWLQQTSPAIQLALRGILDKSGIPTEYSNRSGQTRLRMGEEEVFLAVDQALGLFGLGIPGLSKNDFDPETGAYKVNSLVYQIANLLPGMVTQAPRWVKAAKNPGWNESYKEGVEWFLRSLLRTGAKTPFSGKREYDKAVRHFTEGFDSRETKGHAVIPTTKRGQ